MYSVRAYAIGYAVAELPYVLFITMAFCSIFYWMTGLANSAEKFFVYWCVFLCVGMKIKKACSCSFVCACVP